MLTELVHPRSVLDVGCGTGQWGQVFAPIPTLGLDEHDPANVEGEYGKHDLTRPFDVGRFDLAICLEVAEHVPEASARDLIASLVGAAPVVAFSAAVPGQRGYG